MAVETIINSGDAQDGMISCGGYSINPSLPLPQFDIGNSLAYEAYSSSGKNNKMLALVQEADLPSRVNVAKLLVREPTSFMLRGYHEQPTTWTDGKKKRIFIQQYPNIPKLYISKRQFTS